jgi:uncharacterized YigZ family protein
MNDTYYTIGRNAQAEITVKHSRFIADAIPVESEDAAKAEIEMIRKREYNASHHCSAYRVGPEGETFRYSDDGEPSNTAGAPIFRQIEGRDLTNTLVVVTRYYGGTNLGTGGLIRAYGGAASRVLDDAPTVERILRQRVSLRFDYDDTSPAMHTIAQFDAPILETNYSDITQIIVAVRRAELDALAATFTSALAGRGTVEIGNRE